MSLQPCHPNVMANMTPPSPRPNLMLTVISRPDPCNPNRMHGMMDTSMRSPSLMPPGTNVMSHVMSHMISQGISNVRSHVMSHVIFQVMSNVRSNVRPMAPQPLWGKVPLVAAKKDSRQAGL